MVMTPEQMSAMMTGGGAAAPQAAVNPYAAVPQAIKRLGPNNPYGQQALNYWQQLQKPQQAAPLQPATPGGLITPEQMSAYMASGGGANPNRDELTRLMTEAIRRGMFGNMRRQGVGGPLGGYGGGGGGIAGSVGVGGGVGGLGGGLY